MSTENYEPRKGYLIGGGIASLAAAVFMIRDGRVRGEDIHIYEESEMLGGALRGSGNAEEGYLMQGERMFDYEQYQALLNLLSEIPSVAHPEITVTEEIYTFNEKVRTHAKARLIDKDGKIADVSTFGLNESDRLALVRLLAEPESFLGKKRIDQLFSYHFFTTNFWYMWATTFAFQPWHGAAEFRRYMKSFMHEFPRISTLSGIKRMLYNPYESIVQPIVEWLKFKNVKFEIGCKATHLDFLQELAEEQIVSGIHYEQGGKAHIRDVHVQDLVIVTNGSMIESSTVGSMTGAPALPAVEDGGAWTFWKNIVDQRPEFGKPEVFCGNVAQTQWVSFTVTCNKENEFLSKMQAFTENAPGTGGIVTFKDSAWLMSFEIPYQPHFMNQPEGVSVFWGYGMFPDREGDYVNKKMSECNGSEILTELLCHLHMQEYDERMRATSVCRPSILPFITSPFMPRHVHDRPKIRPKGYYNLAFASQFTEMSEGCVFTMEYSVRCAMNAVYEMLGIDRDKIPPYYRGDEQLSVLFESIKTMNK